MSQMPLKNLGEKYYRGKVTAGEGPLPDYNSAVDSLHENPLNVFQMAQARNDTTTDHRNNTTVRPTGTACGTAAAFTVLLPPLALTALILHRWC